MARTRAATASGSYKARSIRHSVGRKVTGEVNILDCRSADTRVALILQRLPPLPAQAQRPPSSMPAIFRLLRTGVAGDCIKLGGWRCAAVSVDAWPDDVTVPSLGPRMRCTKCGHLGADESLRHYYGLLRPCAPLRYSRPRGWSRLWLVPWHRRTGSHVPYESLVELRAAYMPDATRTVSGISRVDPRGRVTPRF